MYKENPKTKGSGVICAIPQRERCPNRCVDCFFQSGRSYLEPLEKNLPNMPSKKQAENRIVRVNDENDSNVERNLVIGSTKKYQMKFYNTAIPDNLYRFDAPVVLTINPGSITDVDFRRVIHPNLMFVRFRTNTWNLHVCKAAVQYYADRGIPIVLTFMAYHSKRSIPINQRHYYLQRKRTLNTYWAITTRGWRETMRLFHDTPWEKWVHSCGKIEGEMGTTACRFCGNCIREYFATMERLGA